MERVTQKDVARMAGVSRATVSYVLDPDGPSKARISQTTRERVIKAARKLGYQPNASAQSLRSGRTRTIGVLFPDMKNPHFWQLLTGIEREAHRHGHALLIFHTALMQREEDIELLELARRRIDGAILVSSFPRYSPGAMRRLTRSHRPVVDLSHREDLPFDRIVADYRESTGVLMQHLLKLGHRRIAFVLGVASPELGADRFEPYQRALLENGVAVDPDLILKCGPTAEEGYQAAQALLGLPDRPTAIIGINDHFAVSIIRAAADLGLSVPRDLSVAGFDDVPLSQRIVPRLTTVHRDTEAVGELAVQMLLERIKNPNARKRIEYPPSRLIVRESTGPAPARTLRRNP